MHAFAIRNGGIAIIIKKKRHDIIIYNSVIKNKKEIILRVLVVTGIPSQVSLP